MRYEYRLTVYGGVEHTASGCGRRNLKEWAFPFTQANEGAIRDAVFTLAKTLVVEDAVQWTVTRFAWDGK